MQIIINVDDKGQVNFSTSRGVSYSLMTDVMCTAQLAAMQSTMKAAERDLPKGELAKLKEHLWDQYNQSASNVLDEFIPAHMRPDLTEEAILQKENEILDSQKKR